jgi:hypothetical protein
MNNDNIPQHDATRRPQSRFAAGAVNLPITMVDDTEYVAAAHDPNQLELPGIVHDPVNHPTHYTTHPSGIECIQITEHMGFCLGNAVKYIWRADLKGNSIEDLKKAVWYIEREIERRTA